MITALLLAAGHGRRFGGGKLLAPLGGRPVIRWSAEAVCDAMPSTIVVVAPQDAEAMGIALAGLAVRVVTHAGRDAGMASSIAAGVRALGADCDAVVIALGDQPLVSPDVIRRLVERWRETGAPAVAPRYADGRGHPVLFDRTCFAALGALEGDGGARPVLDSLGAAVRLVEVDAPMPLDVDTTDALARVERSLAR